MSDQHEQDRVKESRLQRVLWERAYYLNLTESATWNRLMFAGLAMLMMCAVGTAAYWWLGAGQWGWLECLYMVLITVTTVGYGEAIPISETEGGVVLTMLVMVSGLGVSFYFLSSLTAFIIEGDLSEVIWRRRMSAKITALNHHYIVCGAGEVGHNVITELIQARREVIIVDISKDHLEVISRRLGYELMSVVGDATEDEILLACGIERAAGVVTALKQDRDNLFVAVTARQLNPQLRIIARATNESAALKMRRAGADSVVCPNTIGGLRMASELLRPAVVGFIDLIIRDSPQNQLSVEEVFIPEQSPLSGRLLAESGIRQVSNSLILAIIMSEGEERIFNPPPQLRLHPGMTLVALGELDELKCLYRYVYGEEDLHSV